MHTIKFVGDWCWVCNAKKYSHIGLLSPYADTDLEFLINIGWDVCLFPEGTKPYQLNHYLLLRLIQLISSDRYHHCFISSSSCLWQPSMHYSKWDLSNIHTRHGITNLHRGSDMRNFKIGGLNDGTNQFRRWYWWHWNRCIFDFYSLTTSNEEDDGIRGVWYRQHVALLQTNCSTVNDSEGTLVLG